MLLRVPIILNYLWNCLIGMSTLNAPDFSMPGPRA